MNKKEILEKSRNEYKNSNNDEQQRSVALKGNTIGMLTGIILCGVMNLIEHNVGYFVIWIAMFFISNLFIAIKTKKGINIFIAIAMGVSLVLSIAVYLSDRGVF